MLREIGLKIPWRQQWTPEEEGELVLFFTLYESPYITGVIMVVEGDNALQEEFLSPTPEIGIIVP